MAWFKLVTFLSQILVTCLTNSPRRQTHDFQLMDVKFRVWARVSWLNELNTLVSELKCLIGRLEVRVFFHRVICVVPPTPLVVRSGLWKKRHNNHHCLRNPPNWRRLDAAGETINAAGTTTNRVKQSTHKFNEIRQTCLRPRGKGERDLIDSTINTTITREKQGDFFWDLFYDTIHEASSIYL